MTLNELISELRKNILRDVSDGIGADEADYLWTDATLVGYINEGFHKFAHLTEYIRDASTPEVTEITLVAQQRGYALHQSVIRILSAQLGNLVLPVASTDALFGAPQDTTSFSATAINPDVGDVTAVVPDYDLGTLHLIGTPSEAQIATPLRLRVSRYPLTTLTLDDPDLPAEFPERFHLDILEWAAFRALRNHDADGESMAKASAHKTQFMDAVDEVKQEFRARRFTGLDYAPSWRW